MTEKIYIHCTDHDWEIDKFKVYKYDKKKVAMLLNCSLCNATGYLEIKGQIEVLD